MTGIEHLTGTIKELLPVRRPDGYKGTFGKVFIFSGSYGSAGCALLAGKAAYRAGAGMVKISSPECNRVIIQTALPEALYDTGSFAGERLEKIRRWSDVYLAGPGIGTDKDTASELRMLIEGSEGTNVLSAYEGVVTAVEDTKEFGTTVKIDMGNGYEATYGQLMNVCVGVGDTVSLGQNIAEIGPVSSYYTKEGTHLYFSITKDGVPVNPLNLIR